MNTERSKHYLAAMGIEVWRLTSPVSSQFLSLQLLDSKRTLKVILFAQINPAQMDKERELLAAIIRALNLSGEETILESVDSSIPIIALGAPLKLPMSTSKIIKTYSLTEMLANPQLKAKVWQLISCFRSMP